jgi:hypothetical protein
MFTVDLTLEASVRRQTAVVCHSAWGPNADRRANSLTCPRKQRSTLEADSQSVTQASRSVTVRRVDQRRASLTAMTKTDADCLRLLPNRRLGSFHRLRDLRHRCPCFRMGLELSQILFGPWIADQGLLFRHGFHSSLRPIDGAIIAARVEPIRSRSSTS